MTRDHKPDCDDERKRIIKAGGKVKRSERQKDDNSTTFGCYRVWDKDENSIGLAMSRSLGDTLGKSCGVIAVPEVLEFFLNDCSKFIVIGSDGIFELLSNNEVKT